MDEKISGEYPFLSLASRDRAKLHLRVVFIEPPTYSEVMEQSMRPLMITGCLVLLSVSGCTSLKGASTGARPAGAQTTQPPAAAAQTPALPPAAPPNQPVAASADDTGSSSSAGGGEHPAVTPLTNPATRPIPAKPNSSAGNRPIKPGGAPPLRPAAPAPPSDKPPTPPTLDLAALEQRLRDTHAIGVFTKLSLKNQVDDLLNQFRALYRGPNKRPPPELRQRYDLLLLKVLSLLQDSDPSLATAISSSREAIWGILADPDKFAKL
jgi:hypothetical protein